MVMTMSRCLCVAIAAAVLALAAPARADAPPRVGVVVQLAVNVDGDRADALSGALADALDRELMVDAVGGADASRALPGGAVPEECLGKADCVKDIASRLDASQLLFLVLVQVGDDVQVDASWVDVASGNVVARPRVTLSHADEAQAVSAFASHATRYLPDAKPRKVETIVVGGGNGPPAPQGVPDHMTLPSWIFAGVAVATGATGTILGLQVRSTYHRCETEHCSDDTLNGISTRAHLTDGAFAIAVASAVAGTVFYLRSGSPAPEVTPAPGGGAVVGIAGTW
jgi:hypothetical protein